MKKKSDGLIEIISKSRVAELAWKYCDLNDDESNGDYNKDLASAIRTYLKEVLPKEEYVYEVMLDKKIHPQMAYGMAWRACLKQVNQALGLTE
jgi:hypothetical protein